MSQHINICWDFFLSILFEFPSCNNLSKLSNSFSVTKTDYAHARAQFDVESSSYHHARSKARRNYFALECCYSPLILPNSLILLRISPIT